MELQLSIHTQKPLQMVTLFWSALLLIQREQATKTPHSQPVSQHLLQPPPPPQSLQALTHQELFTELLISQYQLELKPNTQPVFQPPAELLPRNKPNFQMNPLLPRLPQPAPSTLKTEEVKLSTTPFFQMVKPHQPHPIRALPPMVTQSPPKLFIPQQVADQQSLNNQDKPQMAKP